MIMKKTFYRYVANMNALLISVIKQSDLSFPSIWTGSLVFRPAKGALRN